MSEQTRSLIERHDDAWNTHDVGALADLYTEDVVFQNHTAGEEPVEGRDAVVDARRRDLRALARPALHIPRLYLSDDVCTSEWTARATTPDGRRIEWDGVDVMPIRDGAIARKDVYSTSHIPRDVPQS